MRKATALLLILVQLAVLTRPALAADTTRGPSLLGITSGASSQSATVGIARPLPGAPTLGATDREMGKHRESGPSWLSRFGKGLATGLWNAIPNLWKQFQDAPFTTAALVGGMVVAGLAAPAVALVAGGALVAYGAWQTGGDAEKLGKLAGETAFFGALGLAGVRAAGSVRAAAPAVVKPPVPPAPRMRNAPFLPPKPVVVPVRPAVPNVPPPPTQIPRPPYQPVRNVDDVTVQVRDPIRPGEHFDRVHGLRIDPVQKYHGQLYDPATGRPFVVPAGKRRPLTHEEQDQLARARMNVAVHAQQQGRDKSWVARADRDWLNGDRNPHQLLAADWARVNGAGRAVDGRKTNCAFNAWAGDRALAGKPIEAPIANRAVNNVLDSLVARGTPLETLEATLGGKFANIASEQAILSRIEAAGHGARGVVYYEYPSGAHVLNVVNYRGKAYLLDFQTGKPGVIPPDLKLKLMITP